MKKYKAQKLFFGGHGADGDMMVYKVPTDFEFWIEELSEGHYSICSWIHFFTDLALVLHFDIMCRLNKHLPSISWMFSMGDVWTIAMYQNPYWSKNLFRN